MPRRRSDVKNRVVKRTVAIDPLMDQYVRQTWTLMIHEGVPDPTYSGALNVMLLAAIYEGIKVRGWAKGTKDAVWGFAWDHAVQEDLKVHEAVTQYADYLRRQEGSA